jgi:hypothetical protein
MEIEDALDEMSIGLAGSAETQSEGNSHEA